MHCLARQAVGTPSIRATLALQTVQARKPCAFDGAHKLNEKPFLQPEWRPRPHLTLCFRKQKHGRVERRSKLQWTGSIRFSQFAEGTHNAGTQEPSSAADLVSELLKLSQQIKVCLWCPLCGSASRIAAQILAWEKDLTPSVENPTRAEVGGRTTAEGHPTAERRSKENGHSTGSGSPRLENRQNFWGRPLVAIALALTLALHLSTCSPSHAHSPVQEAPCLVAPSPKRTPAASSATKLDTADVTCPEAEVNHLKSDDKAGGLGWGVFESAVRQQASGGVAAPAGAEDSSVLPEDCPQTVDSGHSYHTSAPQHASSSASSALNQAASSPRNPSDPPNPAGWASLSALSHTPHVPQLKLPPWLTEARLQQFFAEAGEAWGRMNLTISRSTIHAIARGWWFGLPQNVEISEQAYEVGTGESLGSVAGFLGVPLEDLKATNPGVSNPLRPGQSLHIPANRQLGLGENRKWRKRKRKPGKGLLALSHSVPQPVRVALVFLTEKWDRLAYQCQLALEWHPASHVIICVAGMVAIVLGGAVFYRLSTQMGWTEAVFKAWMYVYNSPGADLHHVKGSARLFGSMLFMVGLLASAFFISVFTESMLNQVDVLRSGKSRVVETGHVLVLGWNNATVPLIRELAAAGNNHGPASQSKIGGHRTVVVLAEKEKDEMEAEIARAISKEELKRTRVVCRVGDPSDRYAQLWVAAERARSVVVLAEDDEEPEMADTKALRVVLATKGSVAKQMRARSRQKLAESLQSEARLASPSGRDAKSARHIDSRATVELEEGVEPTLPMVVQAQTARGHHLVKLAGGDQVTTVDTRKLVGRHLVQCAVQMRGLAAVMRRLQSFDDEEFYIKQWPSLTGRTFEEVCRSFVGAVPVGVVDGDKQLLLLPPFDRVMRKSDYVVVVADGKDGYRPLSAPIRRINTALPKWTEPPKVPGKYLIVGWGPTLVDMITEMDNLVNPGSDLLIAAALPEAEMQRRLYAGGIMTSPCVRKGCFACKGNDHGSPVACLSQLSVHLHTTLPPGQEESVNSPADAESSSGDLESLGPLASSTQFEAVILLAAKYAPDGTLDAYGSDSSCLATILLLQEKAELDAERDPPVEDTHIVAEIVDRATKKLVKVVNRDVDSVVGTEMMARVLAMASEDQAVIALWRDLLSADGKDVYLKPARRYVGEGEAISFWELAERARLLGEVALGWRTAADDIEINPPNKALCRQYDKEDAIVVISDCL